MTELIKRFISSIILIPLCLFFIVKGGIFFNIFVSILLLITLYEWHKMSKKNLYYVTGIIFIIISFSTVFGLRNYFSDNSLFLFMLVLIICVFTDIGCYVFGKIFKGPKLTKISPKKTYSGMIGGYVLSISISFLYFNYFNIFNLAFEKKSIDFSLIILIFVISSISQIGDIIVSYFKRISNIKNTGKLIPGHGGLLDRIDGMLFAFPFSFFYWSLNL